MKYYIRNLGYVGNCLLWWRKESSGYTCDLREAGQFTEGEALGIIRVRNGEDIAYPVSEIDSRAQLHVTDVDGIQKLAPADSQVASGGNRKASESMRGT